MIVDYSASKSTHLFILNHAVGGFALVCLSICVFNISALHLV